MSDITYNVEKTRRAFEKHLNISWSTYDNFCSCEGLWLLKGALKPSDAQPLPRENSRSIPGTVIQKLFEVFVNSRIYARKDLQTYGDLYRWFETNLDAIFNLSAYDLEDQFRPEFAYTRDFFTKATGWKKLQEIRSAFNLDKAFTGVELSFIDWKIFNSVYTSKEKLLQRIKQMFPKIIDLFVQQNINLDHTTSEIYQKVSYGPYNLTGSIDFIHNKNQETGYFDTVDNLKDGYELFDGKYNLSSYVKEEQLSFYAYTIFLKTRKLPGRLFFVEWSKGNIREHPFSLAYKEKVEANLKRLLESGKRIDSLLATKSKVSNFFEDNLCSLSAEKTHCTYCLGVDFCPAAKEKGISSFKSSEQNVLKNSTKEDMISKQLDPAKNTHDISL